MKIKRTLRYCSKCGLALYRLPDENYQAFLKRRKCKPACGEPKKTKVSLCFCGARKPMHEDYCCWDHRLIAMKCKQWGIPPNIEAFQTRSTFLESEQLRYNKMY